MYLRLNGKFHMLSDPHPEPQNFTIEETAKSSVSVLQVFYCIQIYEDVLLTVQSGTWF